MHKKAKARFGALGLVLAAAATAAASGLGAAPGDAEAVATIMAIDSTGIIHADLAMTKKLSDPVLAFVQDIRGNFADGADDIADIADELGVDGASTPSVRALEVEGDETVRKLDELDGVEFEKAYLASTISSHTNALATLDRLMRLELSEGVKGHIKEMREHFEKHLVKAKVLRNG